MNIYRLCLSVLFLLIIGCGDSDDKKTKTAYENDTSLTFNSIEYGIIKYNGKKWLDRNLGASKACETYNGEEECWGDLYQWGRIADGHEKRNSNITEEISENCQDLIANKFILVDIKGDIMENIDKMANPMWYKTCNVVLWDEYGNGINEICPAGWHVATENDFHSLEIKNPQDGYQKIKLTLAGKRYGIKRYNFSGEVRISGVVGSYWTSSVKNNEHIVIDIHPSAVYYLKTSNISDGLSVRCVKND